MFMEVLRLWSSCSLLYRWTLNVKLQTFCMLVWGSWNVFCVIAMGWIVFSASASRRDLEHWSLSWDPATVPLQFPLHKFGGNPGREMLVGKQSSFLDESTDIKVNMLLGTDVTFSCINSYWGPFCSCYHRSLADRNPSYQWGNGLTQPLHTSVSVSSQLYLKSYRWNLGPWYIMFTAPSPLHFIYTDIADLWWGRREEAELEALVQLSSPSSSLISTDRACRLHLLHTVLSTKPLPLWENLLGNSESTITNCFLAPLFPTP